MWGMGWALARGLMRHEGSVRERAVRSAFWVLAGMAITTLSGTVQTVILVRLLVPADFGVMRVAGFLIALVLVFTETGVSAAIVQKRELSDEVLNTAWTMEVIRNVLLFALVWGLAPVGARFYNNPVITPILRLVSVRLICSGLSNVGLTLLRRDLDFRKTEIYQVITETLAVAITVVAGFILRNVWALAIGQVCFAVLKVVGSYLVHPYRPRLALSRRQLRFLFGFGVNMTAASILSFFCTQTDSAVVGKVVDLTGLGFYTLAFSLSNLPARCISGVLASVAFPTYAALQRDQARLRKAMSEVLWIVTLLVVPASAGLWLLAPAIVHVVYGPRYAPMVTCFRILTVYGLSRAISQSTSPATMAMGRPRLNAVGLAMRLVVMGSLIYPATVRWGIDGAAAVVVIGLGVQTVWSFYQAERFCGGGLLARWLPEMAYSLAAVAVMAVPLCLLMRGGTPIP